MITDICLDLSKLLSVTLTAKYALQLKYFESAIESIYEIDYYYGNSVEKFHLSRKNVSERLIKINC